jgi:heptosyltransferase-2/heptosyltransferase-3
MNNILVVNVNWVGDVIFSTPVFKALREAYPQARISCLAVPRSMRKGIIGRRGANGN